MRGGTQARPGTAGRLFFLVWPWIICPRVTPRTKFTGAGYGIGRPRTPILEFISHSDEQKPEAVPLIKHCICNEREVEERHRQGSFILPSMIIAMVFNS